jgi:hypothetical protein
MAKGSTRETMEMLGEWGEYQPQPVRRSDRLKRDNAEVEDINALRGRGKRLVGNRDRSAARRHTPNVRGEQNDDIEGRKLQDEKRGEQDDGEEIIEAARILMSLRYGVVEEKEEERKEADENKGVEKVDQEKMEAALALVSLRYDIHEEEDSKKADEKKAAEEEEETTRATANIRMLDDFLKIDPLMYWAMREGR